MNQKTNSKFLYMILFWACPKSGFHIAHKNKAMRSFKEFLMGISSYDPHVEAKIKRFEEDNEGLVIYDEVIESDTFVVDPEIEIMPIIRDRYPKAKYIMMLPMALDGER
jgi:hypothetical protein